MKSVAIGSLIAVGVGISTAHAGRLSVQFAGGGTEVTLGPSETAVIEVVWDGGPLDTGRPGRVTGVELTFDVVHDDNGPALPNPLFGDEFEPGGFPTSADFVVEDVDTPIPLWATRKSVLGPFNRSGAIIAAGHRRGRRGPGGDTPPTVLASFVIRKTGAAAGDTYASVSVADYFPAVYGYSSRLWKFVWQFDVSLRREFDLGWGNPGDGAPRWQDHGLEPFQPLIIHSGGDCNANGIADKSELGGDILLFEDFESGLPTGWTATGLWHVTSACLRTFNDCGTDLETGWAYCGIDDSCDFDSGSETAGVLTAPPMAIPAWAKTARLEFCSAYDGHSNSGNANLFGRDWAWVAINGLEIEDVSAARIGPRWNLRSVDLRPFIGQTVSLEWHFDSVFPPFESRLGWQIDGVRLVAAAADCNTNGTPDECEGLGACCSGMGSCQDCVAQGDCAGIWEPAAACASFCPPSGDICQRATPLLDGASVCIDLNSDLNQPPSSCGVNDDPGWWRYSAPASGLATFNGLADYCSYGGERTHPMAVFDSTCTTEMVCTNGGCGRDLLVVPVEAGQEYHFRITRRSSATQPFVCLSVSTRPYTVEFTRHPVSLERCVGETARFEVQVTSVDLPGAPPTYQWLKGGAPIADATAPSYFIANLAPADAGLYACRVTNIAGDFTSTEAGLSVIEPCRSLAFILDSTLDLGCTPLDLAVANLDGDAALDLGAICSDSDAAAVVIDPVSAAGAATLVPIPNVLAGPKSLAPGEFNIISGTDFAVAGAGGVACFGDLGGGSFGEIACPGEPFPRTPRAGCTHALHSVVVGDFNGRSSADFVALEEPSPLRVAPACGGLGDGGGSGTDFCNCPPSDAPDNRQPELPTVTSPDTAVTLTAGRILTRLPDLILVSGTADEILVLKNLGNTPDCGDSFPFDACPYFQGWDELNPIRRPVGNQPADVMAADFNGDGWDDVAVANQDADTVSIFINTGAGLPLAPVNVPVGMAPVSLAAADFDGDGDLDLAVACAVSDEVSLLLNDGGGGFSLAPSILLTIGSEPRNVVAGDFSGDGLPDLAVGATGPGLARVSFWVAQVTPGRTAALIDCLSVQSEW